MRTFLFLALAIASVPAEAATRNFGVNGFDRIRVDGPFRVKLTTGVAPFATATGSAAAIDKVAMDVQGRTLIVRANQSSWGGYPGAASGPVEIAVGTHELTGAWLNGSGSLDINRIKGLSFDLSLQGSGSTTVGGADVDQLKIAVMGSGNAAIGGRAGKITATLRGLTSLDAAKLSAKDARIDAEGGATVKAAVSNSATIGASGTATIELTGKPACTVRADGSASVSGCR